MPRKALSLRLKGFQKPSPRPDIPKPRLPPGALRRGRPNGRQEPGEQSPYTNPPHRYQDTGRVYVLPKRSVTETVPPVQPAGGATRKRVVIWPNTPEE